MDDHATEVALWRYGLIVPLLATDLHPAEARCIRTGILERKHVFPGEGKARGISERTLRRWLLSYRQGGFEGLKPKTRKDRGRPRNIEPEVLEKAAALREEVPERSTRQIIDILALDPGTRAGRLKRSTLSRHLHRLGKTRRLLKTPKGSFRRYEKDRPNAQWQSDVWHGPYLPDPRNPGMKRRTYLIAFMDDHSRLVTHGAFYLSEDLPNLLDCLKKALLKRGLPAHLYCDNGVIYTSRQFSRIVAELGIHHISARPYAPEGKGKIERFWLTVDSSFLPELRARPAKDLQELNVLFAAWLEQGYHHWRNRETGETPVARFARGLGDIRLPDPVRLSQVFLWLEDRKVDKTGQVPFQGNRYEVDPRLAGRKVQLRYDPFDLSIIQVWYDGRRFDDARPYDLVRQHDQRVRPPAQHEVTLPATGLSYLDLLLDKHEAEAKAALGRIAFHRAGPPHKENDSDV
jgi:transposase InsO family protein